MTRKQMDQLLLCLSIGSFAVMSISFLLMPIDAMGGAPGVLFWGGLLLGILFQITLETRRRSFFAKYRVNPKKMQKPRNGFLTFSSNKYAKVADRILLVSVVCTILAFLITNLKDAVVNDPATISAEAISRQTTDPAAADSRFVYSGTVVATVYIEETNFYAEDVVILLDGTQISPDEEWKLVDGKWIANVTISAEGDHVLVVGEYADRSGNAMNWSSSEYAGKAGTALYTSNNLTIDKTSPTIKVSYNNETVVNEKYYDANRTATVLITDRNFRPNEVELVVVDVDAANKDTSYTAPNLKIWSAWTYVGDNTWEATIPFDVDANYTVTVNYKDIAENVAEAYNAEFTVDKVNPQDLSITYSDG